MVDRAREALRALSAGSSSWERACYAAIALTIAIATAGQLLGMRGVHFSFPPATGLYTTPFRQAREAWIDDVPRTEVGCEDEAGVLHWTAVDHLVTSRWPGSHHRKLAPYAVLSDSVPRSGVPTKRFERVAIHVLCDDEELRAPLGCRGAGQIGLRTNSITGKPVLRFLWSCPP